MSAEPRFLELLYQMGFQRDSDWLTQALTRPDDELLDGVYRIKPRLSLHDRRQLEAALVVFRGLPEPTAVPPDVTPAAGGRGVVDLASPEPLRKDDGRLVLGAARHRATSGDGVARRYSATVLGR